MSLDLENFFVRYEELLKTVDGVFERVKTEYPDCVICKIKCADCCHALFDLTLIEALYINRRFREKFDGRAREMMMERANQADRKIHRLKRRAYKDHEDGKSDEELLNEMALERVRCPMLNDDEQCDLYEYRPVTCRIYGIPTAIGGKGHTCGNSGFVKGKSYPTVNMDALYQKLYRLSSEAAAAIHSRYQLADMLMPLSMAMLNIFDEDYLGVIEKNPCREIIHE